MQANIQKGTNDLTDFNMQNNIQTITKDPALQQAFTDFLKKFDNLGTRVTMKNGYQVVSLLNPNAPEFIPTKHQKQNSNAVTNDESVVKKAEEVYSKISAVENLTTIPVVKSTETFHTKDETKSSVVEISVESLVLEVSEKNLKILTKPAQTVGEAQLKQNKTKVDTKPAPRTRISRDTLMEKVLKVPPRVPVVRNSSVSSKTSHKTEVKTDETAATKKAKMPSAIKRTLSNNGFRSICANILRPMRACEPKLKSTNTLDAKGKQSKQKLKAIVLQDKPKIAGTSKEATHSPNSKEILKKPTKPGNAVCN